MLTLEDLSQEEVSWPTVETWLSAGPEAREALHARIRATTETEKYGDDDAWQTIHAIRILALAGEASTIDELLDLAAAHGEADDDLWEVTLEALRALASPELFDRYWKAFEEEDDHNSADALITLLVSCQTKTRKLRNELLNRFEAFPEEFAVEILESRDVAFIPHVEKRIQLLAPVIKFAPLEPEDPEEREWAELGFTWYYLCRLRDGAPVPEWAFSQARKRWEESYRGDELAKRRLEKIFDRAAEEREEELAKVFLDPLPEEWNPNGESEADDRIREIIDESELVQAEREKFKDIGRNDPCPCGSGRKFKRCCGA